MTRKSTHNSYLRALKEKGHEVSTDSVMHCRCSKCGRKWFTDNELFAPVCEGSKLERFKKHYGREPLSDAELENNYWRCP